jgi:hypothetical protein
MRSIDGERFISAMRSIDGERLFAAALIPQASRRMRNIRREKTFRLASKGLDKDRNR